MCAGPWPRTANCALEVVAGGDSRQHLHGAERVVGDHAAQREQIALPSTCWDATPGSARGKRRAADRDVLHVAAAAFGNAHA